MLHTQNNAGWKEGENGYHRGSILEVDINFGALPLPQLLALWLDAGCPVRWRMMELLEVTSGLEA